MICDVCGKTLQVGDWPFCGGVNDHGTPSPSKGFEAYFDIGLGEYIQTPGDRNKAMRPRWEKDYVIHLQDRGKSDSYYRELNQRREERRARVLEGKDQ